MPVPTVPHRKAGVSCNGSIIPEQDGGQVTLKCNTCGAVVGRVNAAILEAWEEAISDQFVIQKFNEADEREVLTGISEMCQRGDCDQCPGRGEHEGKKILCIHACHQILDPGRKESVKLTWCRRILRFPANYLMDREVSEDIGG